MFSGAIGTSINGGTFTIVQNVCPYEGKAPKLLQDKVASGAFHNSSERYDPPKCHEGTREAIIEEIMDWIRDLDKQEFFLWLYGPAGAGKSAIAQTIAEMCSSLGLLAASFFFSRTAASRNNDTLLIPTLAYQLTVSIPEICEFIYVAIDTDPLIFTRSLEAQLEDLILQPLLHVFSHHHTKEYNTWPRFIIIDGLDECSQPNNQRYVLTTLSSAIQRHRIPLNFLIASRPELEIREAFNQRSIDALSRRLVLDDKYKPDADIKVFLTSKFDEIKNFHPLKSCLPVSWPSASDIKCLIQRSSGQFIYASTVMKFVESLRHRPTERLKIVLGFTTPGKHIPFAELDAFYLHIFASVDDIEAVKEVFSFLLFGFPKVQKRTDFVENFFSYQIGDLQMILADLHSIVCVPSPHQFFAELRLFHTSLYDFLTDKSRSGSFYIDAPAAHARLAKCCLDHINNPSNFYGLHNSIQHQSMFRAAFLRHCSNAHPNVELLQALTDFNWPGGNPFSCPTDDEDLTYVPAFSDWLRNQVDDNGDLYTRYLALYDVHLHSQLPHYPSSVHTIRLLIMILNLQIPLSGHDLCKIIKFPDYRFKFKQVDRDRLRLLGLSNLHDPSYIAMLTAFFADSARSKEYYVEMSRYEYKLLAKHCIEYSIHWYTVYINSMEADARSTDINIPTYLPKSERTGTKPQSVAWAIIREILSRFPGEHELAEYLSRSPKLKNILEKEDIILARAYMKACSSSAYEWDSEEPL